MQRLARVVLIGCLFAAAPALAADDPLGFQSEDDYELQHPPAKNYFKPLPPPAPLPPEQQVGSAPQDVPAARAPDAAPKRAMFGNKQPASQPATQSSSVLTSRFEDKMLKAN